MKKTILATLIASASLGVAAAPNVSPIHDPNYSPVVQPIIIEQPDTIVVPAPEVGIDPVNDGDLAPIYEGKPRTPRTPIDVIVVPAPEVGIDPVNDGDLAPIYEGKPRTPRTPIDVIVVPAPEVGIDPVNDGDLAPIYEGKPRTPRTPIDVIVVPAPEVGIDPVNDGDLAPIYEGKPRTPRTPIDVIVVPAPEVGIDPVNDGDLAPIYEGKPRTPRTPIDVIVVPAPEVGIDPVNDGDLAPIHGSPVFGIDPVAGDPTIQPIETPMPIDDVEPVEPQPTPITTPVERGAEYHIRKVALDIKENGSTTDKIVAMNKALKASNSEFQIAPASINADGSKEFIVIDGEGNEHVVSESDFKKAAKEVQERNAADRQTPVEEMPIIEQPELGKVGDGIVQEYAQAAQDEAYSSMAELYSAQALSIDKNAEDIATLFSEVDRLDEKMDGVMAGVHAVNNARPYLSAEGDTAIGAGIGYAGESGAVAFGLAHAFTDGLSASMTLNVTTGSYSEVSGGAGVQYKF